MRVLIAILCGLSATACSTSFEVPRNSVDLNSDGYTLTRARMQPAREVSVTGLDRYTDEGRCVDADLPMARPQAPALRTHTRAGPPLSPGDPGVGAGFVSDEHSDEMKRTWHPPSRLF